MDKFPPRLPPAKLPAARLEYAEAEDRLRERLIGLGYQEIITIPIVDEANDAIFRAKDARLRDRESLAEDASVMRSTGAVTMAATLEWNLNHGQRNVRLFEFGKTYGWRAEPVETRVLTLGATGLAREKGVAETERAFVFADLKGDLDQIGQLAGGFRGTGRRNGCIRRTREQFCCEQARSAIRSAMPGNSRGASPNDSSCARMLTSRNWNLRRSARVTKPRARRCATNRFRVFRRSSAIFPWFSPMEHVCRRRGNDSRARHRRSFLDRRGGSVSRQKLPAGKFSLLVRVTFESHHATSPKRS